ncbi:ParB N-terminal domain-containing protein [Sinorhizobium saheli]|uniref:Chromosome partitioning protein ParB n=1 Tax=Sinorhizobium saheli TaxID=36856 RepID=A0A178XYS7_SINSA|nr:ParB N-terminal domain-containing protein [Sinorhizobium saheli]MQW90135.1 chromosome partitioning protein ParB [Sinorhizobium saheli]OAP40264.1 chromosome partitioning protein ParB [Sinorhizobium saheli]
MAEFKRIRIAEIVVPERLRAVEEEHAIAIAQSMVEHGQINPITVRATPAAKGGKFTLVAGAHRLRACVINDDAEIDAMVVEGDKAEAHLVEITENLFRNELSVIDRAVFLAKYREVWEQKNGKVEAGRPGNSANLALLFEQEAESGGFSQHVADRMGLSRRAYFRLSKIAQNLHPKVRERLRGTPHADNQSELLKIAKLGPTEQGKLATALAAGGDLKAAWTSVVGSETKMQLSDEDRRKLAVSRLLTAWDDADEDACIEFLRAIYEQPDGVFAAFIGEVAE